MARFKNGILGVINGRVGNLVIRKMNGKDYISLRPRNYNKSKNKNSINFHAKFSMHVKLASFLNRNPLLSEIWKQLPLNSISVFHKILKTNLAIETDEILSTKHIIVPLTSFKMISALQFDKGKLKVTFINCSGFIDEAKSQTCTLYILLVLYNSLTSSGITPRFINFLIPLEVLKIKEAESIELTLNDELQTNLYQEKTLIIYAAVLLKNKGTSPFIWSNTYSQKIFL